MVILLWRKILSAKLQVETCFTSISVNVPTGRCGKRLRPRILVKNSYCGELGPVPFLKNIPIRLLDEDTPCMRGGHQMAIDPDTGRIYLFGGWNGSKDLSDFWVFDQEIRKWTCISLDTRRWDFTTGWI